MTAQITIKMTNLIENPDDSPSVAISEDNRKMTTPEDNSR
jgi:hypothetical protein